MNMPIPIPTKIWHPPRPLCDWYKVKNLISELVISGGANDEHRRMAGDMLRKMLFGGWR